MNKVARSAIDAGKIVALEQVNHQFGLEIIDDPVLQAIARKLQRKETLQASEIEFLLCEVSAGALLSLVGRNLGQETVAGPVPVTVLDLQWWRNRYGHDEALSKMCAFLRAIPYGKVRVVLQGFQIVPWTNELSAVIRALSNAREGVRLVLPPAHRIVSNQVIFKEGQLTSKEGDLFAALMQLRAHGVASMQPSPRSPELRIIIEQGFEGAVITYLDHFSSAAELASELVALNTFSGDRRLVKLWVPGFQEQEKKEEALMRDWQLLKTLAVGSLVLQNVEKRRASNRFLSLRALALAPHFGANEFGVGATDGHTAKELGLISYDALVALAKKGQ